MAGTGLTASAAPAGDGVILRWSEAVYRHMALGLWLAGLCAPTLIAAMSLAPVSANAPLLVAACLPVAPALASGLYAVRRWRAEGGAAPFALLLAGLRGTAMDVLRWWAPVLAVAALLTVNLVRPPATPSASPFTSSGRTVNARWPSSRCSSWPLGSPTSRPRQSSCCSPGPSCHWPSC